MVWPRTLNGGAHPKIIWQTHRAITISLYSISICEEDDYEQAASNTKCWTGRTVGQYTQHVTGQGESHQYNPEVPLAPNQYQSGQSQRVNELVDKLIKLRHMIEVSTRVVGVRVFLCVSVFAAPARK